MTYILVMNKNWFLSGFFLFLAGACVSACECKCCVWVRMRSNLCVSALVCVCARKCVRFFFSVRMEASGLFEDWKISYLLPCRWGRTRSKHLLQEHSCPLAFPIILNFHRCRSRRCPRISWWRHVLSSMLCTFLINHQPCSYAIFIPPMSQFHV